ncbi:MAG: hypothetical protein EAY72_13670, partial [Bacteroidetes bacterium]
MTKAIACRWGLAILACLFSVVTFAQTVVTGKVTDKKGAALSGVSVSVPGGGAITDDKGSFSLPIKVRASQVNLTFFSVGFKQVIKQVDLTKKPLEVTVVLEEDVLGLDEVIVTGTTAGTTKKQLGNYVATVKAEDLNKGAAGNVLQALQGKTAGAQISQNSGDPAGGLSVRLRGISSISGSSEPLYIVDGVIVNNGTNRVTNTQGNYDGANVVGTIGQSRMVDINPADIDRIEVLNGAAAAAIYGSRANAGVVQIFTKRGSSGAPKITFSTRVNTNSLRKRLSFNSAPTKFGGPTDGPGALTQDILTLTALTTSPVTRYDYQDQIFRTGLGTDNNIIPASALLKLNLRWFTQDDRKIMLDGIKRINEGIALANNLPKERYPVVKEKQYVLPLKNDPALVDKVQPALSKFLGEDKNLKFPAVMGSEDFHHLVKDYP